MNTLYSRIRTDLFVWTTSYVCNLLIDCYALLQVALFATTTVGVASLAPLASHRRATQCVCVTEVSKMIKCMVCQCVQLLCCLLGKAMVVCMYGCFVNGVYMYVLC